MVLSALLPIENLMLVIQVILYILELVIIVVELLLFVVLVFLELRDVAAAVGQSLPLQHPLSVLFLIHIPPFSLIYLGQHQHVVLLLHTILRIDHLSCHLGVEYLRVVRSF